MKATISGDIPQPKPPRVVKLEMTEDEARILYALAGWNVTIPHLLESFYPTSRTSALLDDLKATLINAGIRLQS